MSEKLCDYMMHRGAYGVPCGRRAKVERDGKWYCGTHDPKALEQRAIDRRAREDEALAPFRREYQEATALAEKLGGEPWRIGPNAYVLLNIEQARRLAATEE